MSESLPCIVCRKRMERVMGEGGYELQPSDGLHFSTQGAYGSTAFDPMDLSTLDVVICDECIVKAGHDGIVRLAQPRIEVKADMGDSESGRPMHISVGHYSPDKPEVVWNPDTHYDHQEPLVVEPEEVGTKLTRSIMWWAEGVEQVRDIVARGEQ